MRPHVEAENLEEDSRAVEMDETVADEVEDEVADVVRDILSGMDMRKQTMKYLIKKVPDIYGGGR